MKLNEYLTEMGIPIAGFARRVGVSMMTIRRILEGAEPKVSVALKIEELTKGQVTCHDLVSIKKRKTKTTIPPRTLTK